MVNDGSFSNFLLPPHPTADSGVRKKAVSKRLVLVDVPWTLKSGGTRILKMERRTPKPQRGYKKRNDGRQKPERGYIRHNHPFTKLPLCFLSTSCCEKTSLIIVLLISNGVGNPEISRKEGCSQRIAHEQCQSAKIYIYICLGERQSIAQKGVRAIDARNPQL